jgi:hypothetical protein
MSRRRGVLEITSGELGPNWDRSEVSGGSSRVPDERSSQVVGFGVLTSGGDRRGTGGARRGSDATAEVGSGTDGFGRRNRLGSGRVGVGSWVDGLGSNRTGARLVCGYKSICGLFQVQKKIQKGSVFALLIRIVAPQVFGINELCKRICIESMLLERPRVWLRPKPYLICLNIKVSHIIQKDSPTGKDQFRDFFFIEE